MTTVYLIRHAPKMEGPASGLSTTFDYMQPLSAEGEERAKQLLDIAELRGADYAVASTMSRSLATLRYLIEADKIPFDIDERLRERDRDHSREPAMRPEGHRPGEHPEGPKGPLLGKGAEPDLQLGDESAAQCASRMSDAILKAVREHPEQKILVGSHGAALGAYLTSVIEGVDEELIRSMKLPDVFRLTFDGDKVTDCVHLDLPFPAPPMPPHPGDKGGPPPRT